MARNICSHYSQVKNYQRAKGITRPVMYHDPCQIARNGGVMDEPRFILRTLCADYREISPEPNYNWCCGGGGGLVALGEETFDFRMKSSRIKADQIAEFGKCAPGDGGILAFQKGFLKNL